MIGERIKKARIASGYTQKELAINIGKSASIVSQYEKGIKYPRLDTFLKLVDVLGVKPNFILGKEIGVTYDDTNFLLSKKDLEIINKIKKYNNLYKLLNSDRADDILSFIAHKF